MATMQLESTVTTVINVLGQSPWGCAIVRRCRLSGNNKKRMLQTCRDSL